MSYVIEGIFKDIAKDTPKSYKDILKDVKAKIERKYPKVDLVFASRGREMLPIISVCLVSAPWEPFQEEGYMERKGLKSKMVSPGNYDFSREAMKFFNHLEDLFRAHHRIYREKSAIDSFTVHYYIGNPGVGKKKPQPFTLKK